MMSRPTKFLLLDGRDCKGRGEILSKDILIRGLLGSVKRRLIQVRMMPGIIDYSNELTKQTMNIFDIP